MEGNSEPYAGYKDKEKRRAYKREYIRKYMRAYRAKCRSLGISIPWNKKYFRRLRNEVLQRLGGPVCAECGCDKEAILELNHKKGGGGKDKRARLQLFRDILKGRVPAEDFNVLCRVCNALHYVRDLLGVRGHKVTWLDLNPQIQK